MTKEEMIRKETLDSLVEYIATIDNNATDLVMCFRNNKIEEALKEFVKLIDGLEWIDQVLVLTSVVDETDRSSLRQIYDGFVEALENTDYVMVADLIEYELMPKLFDVRRKIMQ